MTTQSYTIKSGDNLTKIASQYGTTLDALTKANNISNPNLIYAGKSLMIPGVPQPAPSTAITSSSGPARTADAQLGSQIKDMSSLTPTNYVSPTNRPLTVNGQTVNAPSQNNNNALTTTYNASMTNIDNFISQLQQRRDQTIAQINNDYNSSKTTLEDTQKRESGATGSSLIRLGGYLGESGSASGVLLTQANDHKAQLLSLQAKRDQAVQAAENAFTDKQFDLARFKVEEARKYEQEINDRNDKFFSQALQYQKAQQDQQEFMDKSYQDTLKNFATLSDEDLTRLDPKQFAEIDGFYGVKGFAQNYIKTTQAANKIKSAKDALAYKADLLNFMQDLGPGKKVEMPDGSIIEGISDRGDISVHEVTGYDSNGNKTVTMVTYNKMTGQSKTVRVPGSFGKSGDGEGGGGFSPTSAQGQKLLDVATMTLEKTMELDAKDGATKLKNTDEYLQMRDALRNKGAKLADELDKRYVGSFDEALSNFGQSGVDILRQSGVFIPQAK